MPTRLPSKRFVLTRWNYYHTGLCRRVTYDKVTVSMVRLVVIVSVDSMGQPHSGQIHGWRLSDNVESQQTRGHHSHPEVCQNLSSSNS